MVMYLLDICYSRTDLYGLCWVVLKIHLSGKNLNRLKTLQEEEKQGIHYTHSYDTNRGVSAYHYELLLRTVF